MYNTFHHSLLSSTRYVFIFAISLSSVIHTPALSQANTIFSKICGGLGRVSAELWRVSEGLVKGSNKPTSRLSRHSRHLLV